MKTSRRFLTATAALVAAVAVVAGLLVANAAHLDVSAGQLSTAAVTHPCPGTASMLPANWQSSTNYRSVVVALPAGCAGRAVGLHFDRPNTANDRDGSGIADAAGVASVRMSANFSTSTNYTLFATVDGWPLPIAWSTTLLPPIWCTVIDASGATCTAEVAVVQRPNTSGQLRDYYDVIVRTTSATPVRWEVGFNLAHAHYGGQPQRIGNSDLDAYFDGQTSWASGAGYTPPNDVSRVSQCGELPILTVRGVNEGPTDNSFRDVRSARERRFTFVLGLTGDYDDVVWPGC